MDINGEVSVPEANSLKQRIGDAVNWEKRAVPMHDLAEKVYRSAYGAFKEVVNSAVPEAADLNSNLSNLIAAKNALKELWIQEKAGRGPLAGLSTTQKAEAAIDKVAPAAIKAGQTGAEAVKTVVPPSVAVGATKPTGNN